MEKAQQEQAHDSALVKTILIVEDDRTHRNLMQKILHECEFETVPAENGAIALSKLDETSDFDA
jgi:CheY-like chemotaxis protein